MKKWILSILIVQSFVLLGNSQDTIIRIGPSMPTIDSSLKPIFIYDGVLFYSVEDINLKGDSETIDSIYVRKDIVFNCNGDANFYGIVEIYTKDSIHTGLKHILNKTDYWLYKNPLALLEINGEVVKWNKKTAERLFELKPENIKDIKIIDSNNSIYQANGLLILTIEE
jgi:hypothetical protein